MPKISLVVCLYKERDLLERLLQHADGCYDDLVVVHDGPEEDNSGNRKAEIGNGNYPKSKIQNSSSLAEVFVPSHRWPEMAADFSVPEEAAKACHFWSEKTGTAKLGSIHELVARYGGRFFEGPRCWQQEPHWPFAWAQAKHDWILRLDADEFPSAGLKDWLVNFHSTTELQAEISGYTCIWPLWTGNRSIEKAWPDGRIFLINKKSVRFAGMAEMVPYADQRFAAESVILHHTPKRKSFGFRNLIFRRQAYRWRRVVALSLLATPLDLACWRWRNAEWPQPFKRIREHPIKYSIKCVIISPCFALRQLIKNQMWSVLYSFPSSHWQHAMICCDLLLLKLYRLVRSRGATLFLMCFK